MQPRNARQGHPTVRHHLWELYKHGALKADPDAEETALEVLKSGEDDLVAEFFHWLQPQDFIYQQPEGPKARLFHEPGQRELHGEIYVGDTPEKQHRATVALSCFERGHMEIDGPTGSGKSTFANTIVPQIARHVPVTVIDALNQHAPAMPPDFLILFFEDYEINPLRAPGRS